MKLIIRKSGSFACLVLLILILAACGGEETGAENTSGQESSAVVTDQPLTTANGKLNMNVATGEEFQEAIPDFSDRMVREFGEYRPYISIQQFRREIGKDVDDEQIEAYERYIYVPVDVDNSDAATLMQIPGPGAILALAATYYHPLLNPTDSRQAGLAAR